MDKEYMVKKQKEASPYLYRIELYRFVAAVLVAFGQYMVTRNAYCRKDIDRY